MERWFFQCRRSWRSLYPSSNTSTPRYVCVTCLDDSKGRDVGLHQVRDELKFHYVKIQKWLTPMVYSYHRQVRSSGLELLGSMYHRLGPPMKALLPELRAALQSQVFGPSSGVAAIGYVGATGSVWLRLTPRRFQYYGSALGFSSVNAVNQHDCWHFCISMSKSGLYRQPS